MTKLLLCIFLWLKINDLLCTNWCRLRLQEECKNIFLSELPILPNNQCLVRKLKLSAWRSFNWWMAMSGSCQVQIPRIYQVQHASLYQNIVYGATAWPGKYCGILLNYHIQLLHVYVPLLSQHSFAYYLQEIQQLPACLSEPENNAHKRLKCVKIGFWLLKNITHCNW